MPRIKGKQGSTHQLHGRSITDGAEEEGQLLQAEGKNMEKDFEKVRKGVPLYSPL